MLSMRRIYLTISIVVACYYSHAQTNTFPPNGNVGIGTAFPAGLLHLKSLNGLDFVQITKGTTSPNLDIISSYDGSDDSQSGSFAYGVRASDNAWQIWEKHANADWNKLFTVNINGNVGIGVNDPANKLEVNGTIHSKEVKVDLLNWPDYVFKRDYQLLPLTELKIYIDQNLHLPEIPTEDDIKKGGLNLGEMNKILVKKVEELTLYLIEQNKQVTGQMKIIQTQQEQMNQFKKQLDAITSIKEK